MTEQLEALGHQEIGGLVLQALVRKLIAKGLLTEDDVRDLLFTAATQLEVLGETQTPQAARRMVDGDLAPAFLGRASES